METKEKREPDTQYLDVEVTLSHDGTAWVRSKAMKCEEPTRNITRSVAILVSEWLDLIECEFGYREGRKRTGKPWKGGAK
jgi:hypothetical protein